ncbi:DUF7344 domain-containing protein [Haloarcula amylovorans]|uniref:DUF7344 domain-containing protein n=1 Tax=Haloarcula amylovorans TaxID=2562280 RepID=UPI0010763E48|nr:hypothetical protein [Halomicroarcula amylolytica]
MSPDDESPLCDEDSETGVLPDADSVELLASRRRRTLLGLLIDAERTDHSLESLATAIAQTERESGLGAIPSHRVAVSLYHVHLPKLDAAGVLDYDRETNRVRYCGDERIEAWLAAIDES